MFKKCLIQEGDAKVIDAIRVLDSAATGIVLVVDKDNRLKGAIGDGDIRRGFLRGETLDSPIVQVMNAKAFTVPMGTSRAQVLDIMKARKFNQVPIVDVEGKVVGLHLLNKLISDAQLPNAAVIMCGGKGERLGKLTKSTPKPMLQVAGRPILERIVLHLLSHGVTHIYLAVNYLKEIIMDYFGDGSKLGCHIEYLEETQPLGSGGPLSLLPPQEHPVVVMNGDLITDINISRMVEFHEQNNYHATMGYTTYKHTVPFGCLEVEDGRILDIIEKPTVIKRANAGIYVISSDAIATVPKDQYFMITDIFGNALKNDFPCGAYPVDGDWIDVGQPTDLGRARGE